MLLLAAGCQQQDRDGTQGRNGGADGADSFTSQKQELRQKLQDTQNDIDRRLGELQAKLADASAEERDEINQKIQNLNEMKNQVADRLGRIDNVTQDQWQQFKTEADQTLEKLEGQLKEIGSDIKEQTQ
jgi:ABC-type transporter Mla subunit MlaD